MNKLVRKFLEIVTSEGKDWYREANAWCNSQASRYSLPLETVCGVMSALSPGTNWEQNKKDTIAILEKRKDYKCTTYGPNVLKAREILADGIPRFSMKTGPKTYNFYYNILDPEHPDYITIDRHAYTIATDEMYSGLHTAAYLRIAERYRKAADILDLLPSELQAILWVDYRVKHEIKFEPAPF